jgi:hypothetical protein
MNTTSATRTRTPTQMPSHAALVRVPEARVGSLELGARTVGSMGCRLRAGVEWEAGWTGMTPSDAGSGSSPHWEVLDTGLINSLRPQPRY